MAKDTSKCEQLAFVFDSHSDQFAIYVDGVLRGEFTEQPAPEDIYEIYVTYVKGSVALEWFDVDSTDFDIWNDEDGAVNWPEQIAALNIPF